LAIAEKLYDILFLSLLKAVLSDSVDNKSPFLNFTGTHPTSQPVVYTWASAHP